MTTGRVAMVEVTIEPTADEAQNLAGNEAKAIELARRVAPTQESILPPGSTGAFVTCYAGGSGYEGAVQRCLAALAGDGLRPDEILQPINAMAASDWAAHVTGQWPDQTAGLPDQATFEARIGRGETVYGPFGTFSGE